MRAWLGSFLRVVSASRFEDGGEEGRRFLQQRLAFTGICALSLIAIFYWLSFISFLDERRGWPEWWEFSNGFLGITDQLILLVVWIVCRRGRLSHAVLNVIDFIAFVSLCYAMMIVSRNFGLRITESFVVITFILILVVRAVIIPSGAVRSVLIGVCGAAAPVLTVLDPPAPPDFAWYAVSDEEQMARSILVLWVAFGVGMGALISRVIYGLRRQVVAAEQLGRYRLEERLGGGGMGEVFRARHAMLRRPTAVKLLRAQRAGPDMIERFEREVQLTASLTHPNTIVIYDYGKTPEGDFYYAMELLDGLDLEALVRRCGPLPPERVAHILIQVCASLHEAHGAGLIHRDIKPANIILTQRGGEADVVKVLDFGLVKRLEEMKGAALTADHTLVGTPQYLAPETIDGTSEVGPAVDLYALGAVGYYLLTGRTVFEAATLVELCRHHSKTTPAFLSTDPDDPAARQLRGLLLRCLNKRPEDRPESAAALRRELERSDLAVPWTPERAADWWRETGASRSGAAGSASDQGEETARLSAATFQIDLADSDR